MDFGKGADKSKVTQYQIGNPNIAEELQTKTISGSGARSITLEDLQVMSNAELIETNPNTNNPTEAVYMPSLNGVNVIGKCIDANKKSNLPYIYKVTEKDNFNIKPEYSSLSDKIFKENLYYWLAFRSVLSNSNNAYFIVHIVYSSRVDAYGTCYGTVSSFYSNNPTLGVRPVVYLEPGVSLNEMSAGVWQLIQ